MAGRKKAGDESNKENVSATTRGPRAFWTSGDKAALVDYLLEQMKEGRDTDNSFKPVVWTGAAEKLNEIRSRGAPKTAKTCKKQFEEVFVQFSFSCHDL